MKTNKTIKIITIILLIAIITIASIFGIYKLKDYKVRNVVPEYLLGMEFTESRVIDLAVDTTVDEETETKVNPDEVLTIENYKKTKSILKNRLKKLGADQYRINLDESNGNLQIRIPENKNTDTIIYNLLQSGTFEIKDTETKEVLIDTSKVTKATVVYGQTETNTAVYLQVKLNKEGKQKLEEISKIYIQTKTEKTNEEGEVEESTETKNVGLYLNGESVTETYFGEPITNGILNISIGAGTNSETLQQYIETANEAAVILNSGILPIVYTETDYTEIANITDKQKDIAMYAMIAIVVIMIVVFIIILKTKGMLAAVLQIGYIALLLLTLRYTNVKITKEGILGIFISAILNYIYTCKAFKNIELNFVKDTTKKYALKLIPVYVIAIILSFNNIANIYSIGMTLVWGIIIMYLYNLTLTRIVIDTIKE